MSPLSFLPVLVSCFALAVAGASAAGYGLEIKTPGDRMLEDYFRAETARLRRQSLAEVKSREDWERLRPVYRKQLFEMLGLDPLPARGELKAVVTGRTEREDFTVENLHFQSSPGLYVTANLYRPRNVTKPAPTILYLSGHGPVISNGVSYGNKVSYQHHGIWFARNGYICLVLDTLQLGEIQGLHHGTYREGMWWWNSRGYTPAGVEAWNCIRALDYLATRPDVDMSRMGATGRSGGGAYSWWIAALDDRIKAAAPVAGITDLENHVVDGCVEGHCDCMFTVNTYRWDYPQVAALVAPRPLLIVNTDADSIFPLEGVQRTHAQVRRIYELHKANDNLGLVIGPGPHKDTQDLQVPVFRWFNKHLKGEDPVIAMAATKMFAPQELKVFSSLPTDALNTNIHDTFVPMASKPEVPRNHDEWSRLKSGWLDTLKEKSFGGWPAKPPSLELQQRFSVEREGIRFQAWDFTSQEPVRLRFYIAQRTGPQSERVVMTVLGESGRLSSYSEWLEAWGSSFTRELSDELAVISPAPTDDRSAFEKISRSLQTNPIAMAWVAPRGVGLSAWSGDARKQTQIRRRFMLLGQTLDTMRVWDIRRSIQALRSIRQFRDTPLWLQAEGNSACDTLYASLFEEGIARLDLWSLPASHRDGPDFLNVLRVADVPQAVAMAAERTAVQVHDGKAEQWKFPVEVAHGLKWSRSAVIKE